MPARGLPGGRASPRPSKGLKVLLEPFNAGIAKVGFYQTADGAVVEFMEYYDKSEVTTCSACQDSATLPKDTSPCPTSNRRDFLKVVGHRSRRLAAVRSHRRPLGGRRRQGPIRRSPKSTFTLATMPQDRCAHAHRQHLEVALDDVMQLRNRPSATQLGADLAMFVSLGSADPPDMDEFAPAIPGPHPVLHQRLQAEARGTPSASRRKNWSTGRSGAWWASSSIPGWNPGHPDRPGVERSRLQQDGRDRHGGRLAARNEPLRHLRSAERSGSPSRSNSGGSSAPGRTCSRRHPRLVVVNAHMLWLCLLRRAVGLSAVHAQRPTPT